MDFNNEWKKDQNTALWNLSNAVRESILHARAVCRRENHLNCAAERASAFVVSLRRLCRQSNLFHHKADINVLVNPANWIDAGILNPKREQYMDPTYVTLIKSAASQVNDKQDIAAAAMKEMSECIDFSKLELSRVVMLNREAEALRQKIDDLASQC